MPDDQGFTVRDRRSAGQDQNEAPLNTPSADGEDGNTQPVDFSSFIVSLAASAQMALGNVPHPETNRPEKNLAAAQQMIDIIALMKDKTRGNLTAEEDALLDQVLFNLRMHYDRVTEEEEKSGGS